jgi:hypothetical protein
VQYGGSVLREQASRPPNTHERADLLRPPCGRVGRARLGCVLVLGAAIEAKDESRGNEVERASL